MVLVKSSKMGVMGAVGQPVPLGLGGVRMLASQQGLLRASFPYWKPPRANKLSGTSISAKLLRLAVIVNSAAGWLGVNEPNGSWIMTSLSAGVPQTWRALLLVSRASG